MMILDVEREIVFPSLQPCGTAFLNTLWDVFYLRQ